MAEAPMDIKVGVTTIKEMRTCLYDQYNEVGRGAKSILFRELDSLRQSQCEDTDSYVAKFRVLYLCLSNMGKGLDDWILVYMVFSGLGDEYTSWATTVQNASRKDVEPPEFSTITAQLLDKSRILAKSSAGTDTTMALIRKKFSKQKFGSTMSSNTGPSTKRSSSRSETNRKKPDTTRQQPSVLTVIDPIIWLKIAGFCTRKKQRSSWLARNPAESAEKPINLLTMETLPSNLVETIASLPTKLRVLLLAEQSTFQPDTLVSPASGI